MSKVLVTGVNGFVGKHLAHELHARGHEVSGVAHSGPAHEEIADLLINYFECDLTNETAVGALPLQDFEAIVSLAGLAKVGASFDDPEGYKRVNVGVFSTIAERLLELNSKARVVTVSTGAIYDPSQDMPLTEASGLITDGSPYALSKVEMEKAAQAFNDKGLDCIIARPFNHSGPGQEEGFLIPDLHKKIRAANQLGKPVLVGNLKTKRDYTDVRDIVRAYADLATSNLLTFNVYNICGGVSRSGNEILKLLLENMGLGGKVTVEVDQSLIRSADPADLYGSHERLSQQTGWQPAIPFEQTIKDFVQWQETK